MEDFTIDLTHFQGSLGVILEEILTQFLCEKAFALLSTVFRKGWSTFLKIYLEVNVEVTLSVVVPDTLNVSLSR